MKAASLAMFGLFAFCGVTANPALAEDKVDRTVLPLPEPKFHGVIGKTYKESKEEWPKPATAPDGAPNVVVILLDDVGFGQTSTFGAPVPSQSWMPWRHGA